MEGLNNRAGFIQKNSPDGGFLQSEEWRKFQESAGRTTFHVESKDFWANVVEHKLPIVGKYFYVPRGPVIPAKAGIQKNYLDSGFRQRRTGTAGMTSLLDLAKKEKAGWIRIEPQNSLILDLIRSHWRVIKAPHDMQPREILMMDITKSEEELLAEMKPKTRYNIRLAEKKNVKVSCIMYHVSSIKYVDEFIRLVKITAKRDEIVPHPENYYRKMFEVMPSNILKLYVAEYQGKVIAANIVIFYGSTATYLHGASDNEYRNVMAPYLLQWQAIKDAKAAGLKRYDLGGVKIPQPATRNPQPNFFKKVTGYRLQVTGNNWSGITRFKTGFAPNTKLIMFPGSYDIVLKSFQYNLYRALQKIKNLL